MDAQVLAIESKVRQIPVLPVSLDDFRYRPAEIVDARVVLEQSSVSLYCLDHHSRRAIFVETPDVDLTNAPFYYQAQYEAARQLIAVPYETLHALAKTVRIDPRRLILIYSTGRCGSTLVSHAFNHADGVSSLSEPDVYTNIQALRAENAGGDAELGDLLRDCTLLLCAAHAQPGAAAAWALKFRSWGIELGDLFFRAFPDAKVIFLYRHAEAWAGSFARMARIFEPEGEPAGAAMQRAIGPLTPLIARYMATHTAPMPAVEMLACLWASSMERCLDLQRQGVPMFAARYEDLKTAPREVLDAMFAYCGLAAGNRAALDRVLEQDSQAGTSLSRASTQASRSQLSKDQVVELNALIQHHVPALAPDMIVPHTFLP